MHCQRAAPVITRRGTRGTEGNHAHASAWDNCRVCFRLVKQVSGQQLLARRSYILYFKPYTRHKFRKD